MTTNPHHIDPTGYLEELLTQASPDLMRQMLTDFINQILSAGQVRGSGVSVLSESRDSVKVGVGVRLGGDVGSLGGCLDGVCVVGVDGIGSYQASGVFQARQRHVAFLLDPIIMLLG